MFIKFGFVFVISHAIQIIIEDLNLQRRATILSNFHNFRSVKDKTILKLHILVLEMLMTKEEIKFVPDIYESETLALRVIFLMLSGKLLILKLNQEVKGIS